jgi:catechol 2,3-dioxygenase-like lactoylglutathione lyase family enzyme
LRPQSLNHVAYVTWNTAETVRFYTQVLGMKLRGHASDTRVSTGESGRFLHTFLELEDGSHVAFFEIDGVGQESHATPVPPWARHIALNVQSLEELARWQQRLQEHGVEYIGPTSHEGIWQSIYFFDPNGVRLELTYQQRPLGDSDAAEAAVAVMEWAETHHQNVPELRDLLGEQA